MLRSLHRYGPSVQNEAERPKHRTSLSLFSSLRVRLLSVVLVAVVPVLAVTFHNFLEQRGQIVKVETEDAMALAASISNQAAQTIEGARQLLTAMAHMPQIRNFRSKECSRLLAGIEKHFHAYRNIGVATPDGEVVCSAAALPRPINFSGHRWFQFALTAHRFTVGNLALEGITGLPLLPLAYPIVGPKEQPAAVMFIGVDLAWLQATLEQVKLPKAASVTLIDRSGTVLARHPDAQEWVGKELPEQPVFKQMVARHGPGTIEGVGVDGVPRLYGFAPVLSHLEANNIYVRVGIPKSVAFADADRALFVNLTLLSLFTLIALLAARIIAGTLVLRPVSALVRATKRLAAGDLSARSEMPHGAAELRQLATGFDQMAQKLETHEARLQQALRGTEERHRLLLESTTEGIFGLDIEGRCTFINKAAAIMLGYQVENCLGEDIDKLVHHSPRDGPPRPVDSSFLSAAKQLGHAYNNVNEIFWRSDGTSFPVACSSHPIWADGNHISGAVVLFSDITERKRTEETLRRRVQEIEALHEIGQTILNATDLNSVVEELLDKTLLIGGFDIGLIRLLDSKSKLRKPVASRGYRNPEKIRSVATNPSDANFARAQAEVTESRTARVIENVPAAQGLRTIKQEGVKSAVVVPARAGDEVLGTILLGTRTARVFRPEEIRLLETIGHQLGIAVQKARLNEAMQRNLERIRALHEIDKAIASTLDLRLTLRVLLEKIELFLPYPVATIRLVNKETGLLKPVACHNLDEAEWKTVTRQAPAGIDRMLTQGNSPVFTRDVQADPRSLAPEFLKKHGLVSSLRVPLLVKGAIIGVITFFTKEKHEFSNEEIEHLTALAGQAAIAIHNAQLYEQTERRKREAEELARVAQSLTETLDMTAVGQRIVTSVREFFDVKGATLRLLQPDGSFLALASHGEVFSGSPGGDALPPATGVTSRAFAEGRPIWCKDTLNDPEIRLSDQMRDYQLRTGNRSMIAAPLRARDKIIGALTLSDQTGRIYTDGEVALLQTFTDQAAIAINNAQLYEEIGLSKAKLEKASHFLARSLRQLGGLYAALTPIASAASTHEMMGGIIDRLMEATGADAALIRVWDKKADQFPIVSQRGFPDYYLEAVAAAPSGGAVDWVIRHGEPIITPDIASESRFKGKVQLQVRLRSCVMLPLHVNDEVRGVMHLASRKLGYFDEEQRAHFLAIARQMGITLENRELFYDLKTSRDELERANKIKEEFLGIMSHELRTPLNVIMGYSSLIRDGMLGEINPEQDDALKKVMIQSTDLLSMLNSILQATQIGGGNVVAEWADVFVTELLQELESIYELPLGKEISINWDYPPLPVVKTDRDKLKQILRNLIDNAIKFTKKGRVTVAARFQESQRQVIFKVSDTGQGIPQESLPVIFDMFRQLDSSETRMHGGVGLGLYVAKKFTELLGGEIRVESEPGEGSVFTVALPVEPRAAAQSQPAER